MATSSTRRPTSRSGCSATRHRRRPERLEERRSGDHMRRVVVTGMGIVSSIGNNTQEVLASLREAKSGIVRAEKYAELGFRCQVHGAVNLEWENMIPRKARRFMEAGIGWNYI